MKTNSGRSLAGVLMCVLFAGCTEATPPVRPDDAIALTVAPLTLPGIGRVCYDVRVTNGPDGSGDVVWARGTPGLNGGTGDAGALCSDRFGNGAGGDISYVGPCDADGDEDPTGGTGARTNSVTVWFDGLYDLNGNYLSPNGPSRWFNPCVDANGVEIGCTLEVLCRENADAPVTFSFTVMRDADQGFFDVAVNFDDVFCSAKVDCVEAFLHNGPTRDATVIVGFACTSGERERSVLHLSDLVLTCNGLDPMVIAAPSGLEGNQGAISPGIFQWAFYQGDELLTSNGEPLAKCYWNRAIGIDRAALAGRACRLTGVAAASSGNDVPPPGSTSFPIVRFDVEVLAADGTLCPANPLNGPGSGVQTTYLTPATPLQPAESLQATFVCTACSATTDTTCDNIDDDCDGLTDEDYVPVLTTTCGVGVCEATAGMGCVDGTLVDTCVPGEPGVGVHTFDDNLDAVSGAVFVGNNYFDVGTGTYAWWSNAGGVGDSGHWYGIAQPLATYESTTRHYGLVEGVSARNRLLGGRIEAAFRTMGGTVRGFNGTTTSARMRWFITAASSDTLGVKRIWVAKDPIEWNPNDNGEWSVHGIDVVYGNFTQWNPFVAGGYVGTLADFEDTARNVTSIGVFYTDAVMNFDVHLHSTWYTRANYGLMSSGTEPVRLGWDNVTYNVDIAIDDNCNGLDDDCDGAVDEDFQGPTVVCGVGACRVTHTITCIDGAPTTCTPLPASVEICGDGIDNDCDGITDTDC